MRRDRFFLFVSLLSSLFISLPLSFLLSLSLSLFFFNFMRRELDRAVVFYDSVISVFVRFLRRFSYAREKD